MGKLRGIKKFQVIPWSYLIGNHMCGSGFISKPAAAPQQVASNAIIKVIKSDGTVTMYDRPINVSALVLEFPTHKICNSDSFYLGKKISALSEDDQLQLGHDYFLLPIHLFDSALTFVTITSFAAAAASKIINIKTPSLSNCQPFEIQKTDSGFLKIRVREEFIFRLVEAAAKEDENRKKTMLVEKNIIKAPCNNNTWVEEMYYKIDDDEVNLLLSNNNIGRPICTTPELWKEYKQLVLVKRSTPWKPKLKIIRETHESSETKINCSNRKRAALVLVAASFRVKWRSSVSNNSRSSGSGVTPVNNEFRATCDQSSRRTTAIHNMKNKKKK